MNSMDFLNEAGVVRLWLHIVDRIGKGSNAILESLGALAKKDKVEKSDLEQSVQNSLNKADTALQSFTETDPTVPSWAKAASKPTYTKAEVGLGNVDNVKQYSAQNPPPYPVTSVNGKTGDVVLEIPDINTAELITIADIDAICGASINATTEVKF